MEPWAKMSSFHLHEKYAKQKKIKYTDANLQLQTKIVQSR